MAHRTIIAAAGVGFTLGSGFSCGFEPLPAAETDAAGLESHAADDCDGDRACPGCLEMHHCADVSPAEQVADTCCTAGDPLEVLGWASAAEAVDVITNGRHAILCGGFGANVIDISDPAAAVNLGRAGDRCQRSAFGGVRDGGRIVYLAHHGDSWVDEPSLRTYLHLLDQEQFVVAGVDVLGVAPDTWQTGDTIVQLHALTLPDQPGTYAVEVGWYIPPSGPRLPASGPLGGQQVDAPGQRILLAPVEVRP